MKRSSFNADESQQISFAAELARKGTHLGSLAMPGLYYFLSPDRLTALAILVPLALLMTLVDICRLRHWRVWNLLSKLAGGMVRRHEEAGDFTGAFYILWSFCLLVALYDRDIAVVAATFIIVGDTFAALIGRRYGRIKFRGKSLEGSLACLASTLLVAYIAYQVMGFPLGVGVAGAFVATVIEAIPDFVDDNLSAPLISGLVMTFMLSDGLALCWSCSG